MRTKEQFLMLWMLGGMMLAGLTACSGSDEEPSKPDDGVKVRRLTITEAEGGAAEARQALTRVSLTEDDGLTAKWTAGDALTYCNLSRVDYGNGEAPYSGGLTAASTAATSRFTGDVVCSEGDYLAVVYPATTFEYNDRYTISLTGQDGTLGKLASTYHYVYGRAQVTSVTGTTANATMGKMKSLLTVCKFSFKDKSTNAVIPIQTLSISYGGTGSDAGTYPQSATVECGVLTVQTDVHASGVASNSPLLLEGSGEAFYVALLPTTGQRTFNFTVTNTNGTYTGTAKATLTEGEYVEATGLKLIVSTP